MDIDFMIAIFIGVFVGNLIYDALARLFRHSKKKDI